MNFKDIKQIVDLMKRSDIAEFDIEEEGLKLRIKRNNSQAEPHISAIPMQAMQTVPPFPMAHSHAPQPAVAPADAAKAAEEVGVEIIKSPMVGTFYSAPTPESAPFVSKGDVVKAETVVCIVEAMKVMNEIQADLAGKIIDVLVENGESVEYGQPLFKIKKA